MNLPWVCCTRTWAVAAVWLLVPSRRTRLYVGPSVVDQSTMYRAPFWSMGRSTPSSPSSLSPMSWTPLASTRRTLRITRSRRLSVSASIRGANTTVFATPTASEDGGGAAMKGPDGGVTGRDRSSATPASTAFRPPLTSVEGFVPLPHLGLERGHLALHALELGSKRRFVGRRRRRRQQRGQDHRDCKHGLSFAEVGGLSLS